MLSPFTDINYLSVIVSAVIYFALGAVWYSPAFFGKDWQALTNVKMESGKGTGKTFLASFLAIFIITVVIAYFIVFTNSSTFTDGMRIGFLTSIGFMAMPLGITFLYEGKDSKLFFIDAGYHFFGMLLAGTILALWR